MLTIKNLTASYGGPDIIHNIHLHINEGEIVTIIGPNGAGKSTILRSIFNLTKIKNGEIIFFGENLIGLQTDHIIKRGICYVPQGRNLFPNMTVEENLEMGGFIHKNKSDVEKELKYVYEKFPKLHTRRSQKAKTMSGGEQQMLALGRALMVQPKLLLLDEPSIGLSPKIVQEIFEKCTEIAKTGTAVLMVEQNANLALEYCNRGYVLELGQNRYEGSGQDLLKDKRVGELYLGKK